MAALYITTHDGTCPAWLYTSEGAGRWPGVILYMDGPGIRPAVHAMAERMAGLGYAVLLPDLFYRSGAYAPVDPKIVFTDPVLKEVHRERLMAPATPARVMEDTAAFLDVLAERGEVLPGPVGVVGYCMGGKLALIAAGIYPDRIAAAASFHAGGLANDTPSSPHLLAPKMTAKIYVAGAIEDAGFSDAMKARLKTALDEAGVDNVVETFPAKHGWVPSDTAAHDPAEAEHHWRALEAFLADALAPVETASLA